MGTSTARLSQQVGCCGAVTVGTLRSFPYGIERAQFDYRRFEFVLFMFMPPTEVALHGKSIMSHLFELSTLHSPSCRLLASVKLKCEAVAAPLDVHTRTYKHVYFCLVGKDQRGIHWTVLIG
eukprot:scaffold362901_cov43-Prasinocladus_malaysianus.AAC.1